MPKAPDRHSNERDNFQARRLSIRAPTETGSRLHARFESNPATKETRPATLRWRALCLTQPA